MTYVRYAMFFLVCFGIGAAVMLGAQAYFRKAPSDGGEEAHTGTGAAPAWRGIEIAAGATTDFAALTNAHATAVAIEWPADGGVTAETLKALVGQAHAAKLAVIIAPPGDHFSAQDPYPAPLAEVATAASAAGADALCVSWLNTDVDDAWWQGQVAAVRKNFSGKVVIGATSDVMPELDIWGLADYAAVVGPIALPRRLPGAGKDYTVTDARALWATKLDEWESICIQNGKPLILLDVSLGSGVGESLAAGKSAAAPEAVRDAFYQGLLVETKGRRSTQGLLLSPAAAGGDFLKEAAGEWSDAGEQTAAR